MQAAVNTGTNYPEQANSLASSTISIAAGCLGILPVVPGNVLTFVCRSYLPTSLTGGTTGRAAETVQGAQALKNEVPPGGVPATQHGVGERTIHGE